MKLWTSGEKALDRPRELKKIVRVSNQENPIHLPQRRRRWGEVAKRLGIRSMQAAGLHLGIRNFRKQEFEAVPFRRVR